MVDVASTSLWQCLPHLTVLVCLDAVGVADLRHAGERLMQSNPSMCIIGDLQDTPTRREVEAALFENGGMLKTKKSFFSFS